MDYRGNLKNLLMKGKMFKIKGQGIGGGPSFGMSRGSGLRLGGTISHRPLNPDLSGDFERFRISSGKGIKKSSNKPKKASKKASSKKKKANFKSLKFNF
jgi:hypothetical protein